jgi:zinc protease
MRTITILFSAALLVWPQAPAKKAAAPAPSYKSLKYPPLKEVKIPEIVTATLPNGVRLFLLENQELPLISGFALVRTGNLFEPAGKVGLAQLTGEVMRTGGTKSQTGEEIDELLENMAASVESGIGETSGTVSFNCLRDNVDKVLPVFLDVLSQPEFRPDKLELAKTQMRSLISRRNDDAGEIASREFMQLIYGETTPYGREIEYVHVDNIRRDDLIEFHRRYFFPANVILAIQGDFKADEMREKLGKLTAGWTSRQEPVPPFPAVSNQPAPGIYVATKEDVTQTFFRLGHLGGTLNDKDYPALEVMSDILGGSFSSRLFLKIRTEKGYAYNIGASWAAAYNHPGTFAVSGSTKSANTTDTLRLVRQEIERIRTSEVTDQELATAKDTVLNGFVFNFDRLSKTLNRLITYEYYGYPKDFIFQYQKAVAAVTKADVLRVAKTHLEPENLVYVAVGKPSDFGEPLAALSLPEKKLDITIPQPVQESAKADAGTLERGRQLLVKLHEAVGGAEKLAAIKDMVATADSELNTGQGTLKAKQKLQWMTPGIIRQDQELPFGKVIAFFDGKSGWLTTPQGQMPMAGPVVDQVKTQLFRFPFSLWLSDRNPERTVNYAGSGVLEITDKQGGAAKLRVDEATGMPLSVRYMQAGMAGPQEVEEVYGDWRDVGGVKMPFLTTISHGGRKAAEIKVQEMKLNTGLVLEELAKKP